jgi:hypothetical protein
LPALHAAYSCHSSRPHPLPPAPLPLQLPAPTGGGRASAKTHLPTDEHALAQLKPLSPLPSLVLEYRALQVRRGGAAGAAGAAQAVCCSGCCHSVMSAAAAVAAALPGALEVDLRCGASHSPCTRILSLAKPPQNFVSKWVEADWARAAAAGCPSAEAYSAAHPTTGDPFGGPAASSPSGSSPSGGASSGSSWPRVHCTWHQTATATGRLSSSAPNLQAVTKYTLEAAGAERQLINIRDAFVAPAGCVLLAADYSQVGAYPVQ